MSPAPHPSQTSAFGPLSSSLFRRIWLANSVSTLGFWMQQVAAAWLMTQLTRSPSLVALLATAAALPTFVFALPAGALADLLDRRRLILATQVLQMMVSGSMAALALGHAMTPALLLVGIGAYGLGNTLGLPPQSAVISELVDDDQLTQAVTLNATSFTAAQALGPAVGGILVAAVGPGWAFLANAASFAFPILAFAAWKRPARASVLPAEHMLSAIRSGARYVANAPTFQLILLRMVLHMLCYAAMPALLVLAVRTRLHAGAGGYGAALGAVGVGGVVAATLILPALRPRVAVDRLTLIGATVLAVSVFGVLATVHSLAAALPGLLVGGGATMVVMSSMQAAAQVALPDWVRGRGLAIVQLTFQASMAVGAAVWGSLGSSQGVGTAFLEAGIAMVSLTAVAVTMGARLGGVQALDLRPAMAWTAASPSLSTSVAAEEGPITTLVEYDIAARDEAAFTEAMREVAKARRRDGAVRWSLGTDSQQPTRHVESFTVSSWAEHERELERVTQADASALQTAFALHRGAERPGLRLLVGRRGRRHLPPARHATGGVAAPAGPTLSPPERS